MEPTEDCQLRDKTMRMGTVAGILLILTGLLSDQAGADGKFYVREKIPAHLPYQRAFLLFDEGTETLVVQSKYELTQSAETDALAWVVPVPSVPELASMDAVAASNFFWTMSLFTDARVRRASDILSYGFIVMFLAGVVLLFLCLLQYPLIGRSRLTRQTWERRGKVAVLMTLLGLLGSISALPHLGRKSDSSVDILKTQQVGIYDVTVIRGDSTEAVIAWLTKDGFAFDESDEAVFSNYVARGWCFVTAKLSSNVNTDEQYVAAEGMVAPLVLTFATDKPVYPLALTATADGKTEILIYTLSPKKLVSGERLRLGRARQVDSVQVTRELLVSTGPNEYTSMEGLPDKPMMLCKFKGTLTAAQMREDLVFEAAPDDAPYRETKWVW